MATELEELLVQLRADNEEFRAEMKSSREDFSKAMNGMQNSVDEFSKKSGQGFKLSQLALGSFVGNLGADIVKKGFEVMKEAASEFVKLILVDGVNAAKEQELALNRLGAGFAFAGQEVEGNVAAFQKFADAIQETTGFEGDAVLKTGALIQSMARLDQDGLQKASQAAIDLSAALGIDLETATQAVGKAAAGQVSGLSRLGIKIQETGDKAFDAANAMRVLNDRFGGSAVNAANTFAAAQSQLGNAFDDVIKGIAKAITQNPVLLATFKAITDELLKFGKVIEDNSAVLQEWIGQGVLIAIDALGGFIVSLGVVIKTADVLWQSLATGTQLFVDMAQAAGSLLSGDLSGAASAFDETSDRANNLAATLEDGTIPLTSVVEHLKDVRDTAQNAFDASSAAGFNDTVKNTSASLQAAEKDLTAVQLAAGKFGQDLAKRGADPDQEFKDRSDSLKAARDADLITEQEFFASKSELLASQMSNEQTMLDQAKATKQISDTQFASAQLQLIQEQNTKQLALYAETNKAREANTKNSLGIIAGLQDANNSTLVAAGKAAGTAQAIIDGQVAIQKAWAVGGPFGAVLAAGVAAATAVQIAKIQGIGLAGGIDSVPGTGLGDSVPAVLTPGERVVPKKTNQDLSEFLDNPEGKKGGTTVNATFNFSGIVDSDGQKIVQIINNALAGGSLKLLEA